MSVTRLGLYGGPRGAGLRGDYSGKEELAAGGQRSTLSVSMGIAMQIALLILNSTLRSGT